MIDSTSFARPFSTISESAAMRSGIVDSVKVSDARRRSSSFVIIGEDLQRPRAGQEKRDGCESRASTRRRRR